VVAVSLGFGRSAKGKCSYRSSLKVCIGIVHCYISPHSIGGSKSCDQPLSHKAETYSLANMKSRQGKPRATGKELRPEFSQPH
jgi:hypothetical protein